MNLRNISYQIIIVILILLALPVAVFADGYDFGVIRRFDSYSKVSERQVNGNGFELSVKTAGNEEHIIINVYEHESVDKEYIPSANQIKYTYSGSSGEPLRYSSRTAFNGIHFEFIEVERLADRSSLTVTITLKDTSSFVFNENEELILAYSVEYQAFLDSRLLEKKTREEQYLGTLPEAEDGGVIIEPEDPSALLKAEYILDEHIASLRIPGLILVDEVGTHLFTTRFLGSTKYLIKFESAKGNVNLEQINTNDYMVKRISISTDKATMMTTIVIESEGRLYFKRNEENEKSVFELNMSTRPFIEYSNTEENNEPAGGHENDGTDLNDTDQNDNIRGTRVADLSIAHTNRFRHDEVVIDLANSTSYNIHRLSEPERIVIDIKGIDLVTSFKQLELNSTYIEKIRYAHFDNNTARVVLDLKNPAGYADTFSPQNNYNYEVRDGKLYIKVEKRIFDKYYYSGMSDRVYLLMIGEHLTSSEYDLTDNSLYTSSYNPATGIYTISYTSNNPYNGKMNINDSYVDYIEASSVGNQTTVRIKLNDRSLVLMPITRYMRKAYWHSTITFLRPKKAGERLIVVDPGHGGADSGAVANGVRESDLNIDIAKRLKNLFVGSNIRIHLTRGDDSYVGLGERTAAANAMNADLFLSIHNNAYYAASNGTETFYYTTPQWRNGVSAAEFSQILQKHLLADLGLYNRGVKQNTFSVLRHANMPSALIEIAFLTNLSDVAKLKDPVFRQKAAVALYKALNEVIARMN